MRIHLDYPTSVLLSVCRDKKLMKVLPELMNLLREYAVFQLADQKIIFDHAVFIVPLYKIISLLKERLRHQLTAGLIRMLYTNLEQAPEILAWLEFLEQSYDQADWNTLNLPVILSSKFKAKSLETTLCLL